MSYSDVHCREATIYIFIISHDEIASAIGGTIGLPPVQHLHIYARESSGHYIIGAGIRQ